MIGQIAVPEVRYAAKRWSPNIPKEYSTCCRGCSPNKMAPSIPPGRGNWRIIPRLVCRHGIRFKGEIAEPGQPSALFETGAGNMDVDDCSLVVADVNGRHLAIRPRIRAPLASIFSSRIVHPACQAHAPRRIARGKSSASMLPHCSIQGHHPRRATRPHVLEQLENLRRGGRMKVRTTTLCSMIRVSIHELFYPTLAGETGNPTIGGPRRESISAISQLQIPSLHCGGL